MEDYYQKNEGLTEKEIILQHLKKLSELSMKEWRGGYVDFKNIDGRTVEVYVEDIRKCFTQGVEVLEIMLSPRLTDDKTNIEGLKSKIKLNLEEYNSNKINVDTYLNIKLDIMLEMLRILVNRLHKTGYLTQQLRVG